MTDPDLIVIAEVHGTTGGLTELEALIAALVTGTRDEPGCLRYRVLRADDPSELVLWSEWTGEAALRAHYDTPHYRYYGENSGPLLARTSDVTVHHIGSTVHPVDSGGPDPRALG